MGPLEEPARPVPHKPVTARLLVASAGGPGPRAEWGWVCGAWHSSGTLEHVASYPSSEALYSLRGHVPQKHRPGRCLRTGHRKGKPDVVASVQRGLARLCWGADRCRGIEADKRVTE